jgi:acetoin utilization protein AcuB
MAAQPLRWQDAMKIERWMKHPVVTVKPRDSALHARKVMGEHRINQLPVVVDGRLVGIVTDRDLRDVFPSAAEAAVASRRRRPAAGDPATIPVEDAMASAVVTLAPGAFVEDAARLMRRHRIGAIPIVDGERLVGILTRSDVLEAFVELTQRAVPQG